MRKLLFLIVPISFLLILSSCISPPPEPDKSVIINKTADLTIKLVPISQEELIKRHGSNKDYYQNPFYKYPSQLPPRRIVVFNAQFSTEQSCILFSLKKIKLKIDDNSGKATSIDYLLRLWDGYKDDLGWGRLEATCRKYMLPTEFKVTPDKPVSGYLVFANNYPKEGGEGLLTLEVSTDSGDAGTIEIPINFTEDGVKAQPKEKNTGIFAEQNSEDNN